MITTKQAPCCSRRTGKLVQTEADLRRLAQRAAFLHSKGRSVVKTLAQIEVVKAQIEADKQSIVDHDADHAAAAA